MRRSAYSGRNNPRAIRSARRRNQAVSTPTRTRSLLLIALGVLVGLTVWGGWVRLQSNVPKKTPPLAQDQIDNLPVASDDDVDAELADPASHKQDESLVPTTEVTFWGPTDPFNWVEIEIRKGDNLQSALVDNGIRLEEARQLVAAIAGVYNVRRVMPGNTLAVRLFGNGVIVESVFRPGPLEEIRVQLTQGNLLARKYKIKPDIHIIGTEVVVRDSLYLSFQKAGVPLSLLYETSRLFSWAIDFSHDVRPNDHIQILWEQLWLKGKPYRTGRVLAARYLGKAIRSSYYLFPDHDHDHWYHKDGRNVAADFIRSPVRFARISSRFSRDRLHPVLGIHRPHSGVDFAAPSGTPVLAAADGKVIGAGWMGGAGNAIRIRHRNGWVTSYSHLSRILVRKGQIVRQRQRIGKVGATGLASGPHLDYRIKIKGRFVNPLKVNLPRGRKISSARMPLFKQRVRQLDDQLDEALDRTAVDIANAAKYTKEP